MKFYYVRLDGSVYERPFVILAEMESTGRRVVTSVSSITLARIVAEGQSVSPLVPLPTMRERYEEDRNVRSGYSPRIMTNGMYTDHELAARTPLTSRAVSVFRRLYPMAFRDMITAVVSSRAYDSEPVVRLLCSLVTYNRPHEVTIARWRGVNVRVDSPSGSDWRVFKHYNGMLMELGIAIKQSIKDDDSAEADVAFLDITRTAMGSQVLLRCYSHYRSALEGAGIEPGVVHTDCGHYENRDNTVDVRTSRSRYDNTSTWCEECAGDRARTPEDDDGTLWAEDLLFYHEDEGEWFTYPPAEDTSDDDDDDSSDTSFIRNYSVNVLGVCSMVGTSTRFGDFTMGIELEMTSGREDKGHAARDVLNTLGTDYCIIKNDGSLPSNGFEVVTAPRMMAEHIAKFTAWTPNPAYRAWDVGSCGLHVHIDSRAFTALTLGKLLMFYNTEANAKLVRRIAGRHPHVDAQAHSYAASESQSSVVDPIKALKGKNPSRYRIVNTTNLNNREADRLGVAPSNEGRYNTVEIRIFRASLKRERLLAQIEFANAAVFFCRETSYRDLNEDSFLKWLKVTSWRYPNLADWFGVRTKKEAKEIACADA
jgi:hypothetical protein